MKLNYSNESTHPPKYFLMMNDMACMRLFFSSLEIQMAND
jgi:hypothetical protein